MLFFNLQGYKEKIVDIREEILRKRRAGKLPGDTTSLLKAWWQAHSKWPYPTVSETIHRLLLEKSKLSYSVLTYSLYVLTCFVQEDDKARLVQETGLQLKQINNWFINQRKRNWNNNPSSSTVLKSKRRR